MTFQNFIQSYAQSRTQFGSYPRSSSAKTLVESADEGSDVEDTYHTVQWCDRCRRSTTLKAQLLRRCDDEVQVERVETLCGYYPPFCTECGRKVKEHLQNITHKLCNTTDSSIDHKDNSLIIMISIYWPIQSGWIAYSLSPFFQWGRSVPAMLNYVPVVIALLISAFLAFNVNPAADRMRTPGVEPQFAASLVKRRHHSRVMAYVALLPRLWIIVRHAAQSIGLETAMFAKASDFLGFVFPFVCIFLTTILDCISKYRCLELRKQTFQRLASATESLNVPNDDTSVVEATDVGIASLRISDDHNSRCWRRSGINNVFTVSPQPVKTARSTKKEPAWYHADTAEGDPGAKASHFGNGNMRRGRMDADPADLRFASNTMAAGETAETRQHKDAVRRHQMAESVKNTPISQRGPQSMLFDRQYLPAAPRLFQEPSRDTGLEEAFSSAKLNDKQRAGLL